MPVSFTSHNIRLDDGSFTKPDVGYSIDLHPWFLAAKRRLDATFPGNKRHLRIADLGCLEGGYTVEFARVGLQALGLDIREQKIEACRYVQSKVALPNLQFARDAVWNVAAYGSFDAVFCCGLLYQLDKPREVLKLLSQVTKRLLILQTHFSEAKDSPSFIRPRRFRPVLARILPLRHTGTTTHKLSFLTENEGLPGRRLPEFSNQERIPRSQEPALGVLEQQAVLLDSARVLAASNAGVGIRFGTRAIRRPRPEHRIGDDCWQPSRLGARYLHRHQDRIRPRHVDACSIAGPAPSLISHSTTCPRQTNSALLFF